MPKTPGPTEEAQALYQLHCMQIGQIASKWAALELLVDQTIWKLAEVQEKQGACITAQIGSIHNRMRALLSLLKLRDCPKKVIKEVNVFSQDASTIAIFRNRIVHSPVAYRADYSAAVSLQLSADKTLKLDVEDVDNEQTQRTDDEIWNLLKRFVELQNTIYAELFP